MSSVRIVFIAIGEMPSGKRLDLSQGSVIS
jgi:hypothetical protein